MAHGIANSPRHVLRSTIDGLLLLIVLLLWLTQLTGCSGTAALGRDAQFNRILDAGDQADVSAIPELVEYLDSDDPAVRMLSISALKRITGTNLGYRPYDSLINRRPAIARWVKAVRSGRFDKPIENLDPSGQWPESPDVRSAHVEP